MKTNLCLVACFALVGMAWGETPKLPGDRVATIAFFEENVYGRKPDLSSFEKRSQVVDRGRWTGTRAIRRDGIGRGQTPLTENC